jgi:cytochrome c oxidase subunit II
VRPSARRRSFIGGLAGCGGAALLGVWRSSAAQAPREIELVAQRFRFTPKEIRLEPNERIVLLIRALDFEHGFSVPDLRLRADLAPGRLVRVELQAPKAGTLDFLCDNFCGDDHEDMHGRFIVGG